MSLSIRRGIFTYYFVLPGSEPPEPGPNARHQGFSFSGATEAAAFLRGLGGDSLTMMVFRQVALSTGVTNPADYSDTGIVDLVARELVRKQLTVLGRYYVPDSVSGEGDPKGPARPAPTPNPGPKTAEPDPDTFGDPDVEQQAQALIEASKNGTPFCEECDKARAQAAAESSKAEKASGGGAGAGGAGGGGGSGAGGAGAGAGGAGGGSGAGSGGAASADPAKSCKLVSIKVVQNATQSNVTGAKNWAAVKKATDDVIVEATTSPNNDGCWASINWSGDAGKAVPGKANQRSFSRSASKKIHVAAELGGVKDELDICVLWATVKINTTNQTPANAVQYGARYDGTENLGTKTYNGGNSAVGKVVPEATITPAGVHDVVKSDWAFRRERISHDWQDGVKVTAPDYWNATWTDDTSDAGFQKLIPDANDKIYDRDAPSIGNAGGNDYETYNNFREWIEWSGMTANEACSDKAEWYWKGVWQKASAPQVTTKEVGTGNIALPATSALHPPRP